MKTLGIPLYSRLEAIAQQKHSSPFPPRAAQVLTGFFVLLQELIWQKRTAQYGSIAGFGA